MTIYTPPIKDILFLINDLAGLERVNALPAFENATADTVSTLAEEAAKYFSEVLAPLNSLGDQQGMQLVDSNVIAPEPFVKAYQQLVESGWPALSFPESEGGFGFPELVELAMVEMMQSANVAFSMCPLLASGVARVLRLQGDDAIKRQYLPKIASGEWSTAMSLTESQSGSDLSGLRTKAVREEGHYRISGQKIFISWADHNMSENVLHLVLARLVDAPLGSRGLSLFLVPKYVPNEDGSLGPRNDFSVVALEHKLGLRASPTCTVSYGDDGGAIGYLIGQPNEGLSAMFILMNHARIQVGMQGAALVERAYQMSVRYAQERVQGAIRSQGKNQVAIIQHADVRRMLALMKAGKDAMKALGYVAAAALDLSDHASSEQERAEQSARVALLTPIVKGWNTEFTQELVQLAVQIHGGMGYIEETGVTQFMRDARVITIYEGTSAMQAKDLLGRKLFGDGGQAYAALLDEMRAVAAELVLADSTLTSIGVAFSSAVDQMTEVLAWMLDHNASDTEKLDPVAFDFMMLSGYLAGGWQMARSVLIATRKIADDNGDVEYLKDKLITSRFYMEYILPRTQSHAHIVLSGGGGLDQVRF
ncbi:MAG: acyl-CoA dehydrogenase [Pseudomonadales bacterium]